MTFVTLIIIYNFKNDSILLKTIFVCDLGFFYYTRFLFVENSHFGIISASIITFFLVFSLKYSTKVDFPVPAFPVRK